MAISKKKIKKKRFISKFQEKMRFTIGSVLVDNMDIDFEDIYDAFIETLYDEIMTHGDVPLGNLGRFKIQSHKGQPVQFTNDSSKIENYLVLRFVPSASFKDAVKRAKLPEN